MSQTILFTENTKAGGLKSWANPDWQNCTMILPVSSDSHDQFSYEKPLPSLGANAHLYGSSLINGNGSASKNWAEKRFSLPNANHPGGVYVAWADGSVGYLNQQIEPEVFAKLVSPSGSRSRPESDIEPQRVLSEKEF